MVFTLPVITTLRRSRQEDNLEFDQLGFVLIPILA